MSISELKKNQKLKIVCTKKKVFTLTKNCFKDRAHNLDAQLKEGHRR